MLSTADYIPTKPDKNDHTVNLKYLLVACICCVTWPSLSLQWPKYISTSLPPLVPTYLPAQFTGPAWFTSSHLSTKFLRVHMRGQADPVAEILVTRLKFFTIWTLQPGYLDENDAMHFHQQMLKGDFATIDFVTYRLRYSVTRDLYCCLVIQLEHDVLIDIWSRIFYFAHVVVDSEENVTKVSFVEFQSTFS